MTVASDSLVHRRESVSGAEVDVRPSLHQHSDGLASAGLTLHGEGQRRFCQENKDTAHLLKEKSHSCGPGTPEPRRRDSLVRGNND